jgi:2,3-bisphosphoglycerate-independent phosphoglycerate mutase
VPSPTMPAALIILDGLGDRADPPAVPKTPLEAARTPNLDALAARGATGLVEVVGPGIAPESDAGALALLGIEPRTGSPGRGVLEALGAGIDLRPGDLALRLNFATGDGGGHIQDPRVGRTLAAPEAQALARALTEADLLAPDGIRAEVRATVGHRGVLWLHPTDGRSLSPSISNADPYYDQVGGAGEARRDAEPRLRRVEALDATAESARSAAAVNRFLEACPQVLAGHSVNARRAMAGRLLANLVLVRSAGALREAGDRSFTARTGRSGAAVTEMPVERGIARWLGLTDRYVGPMGPDRAAALQERARVVRTALADHDFVYVHLKGPDEPGHDGDFARKREIIEGLDRDFFGPFVDSVDWGQLRVAVTADHATPCAVHGHSDDPVPLLITGGHGDPGAPPPALEKFGESACARGRLGTLRGIDVLPALLR